jgi:hypothetical protein
MQTARFTSALSMHVQNITYMEKHCFFFGISDEPFRKYKHIYTHICLNMKLLLNNFMEQSHSSEARSCSASSKLLTFIQHEISLPCLRDPTTGSVLCHLNPFHNLVPYIMKIHFNIIFPPTSRSPERFLPLRVSDQHFIGISYISNSCYIPCPSHRLSFVVLSTYIPTAPRPCLTSFVSMP